MTYSEYQEFLKYPCDLKCENCQYSSWAGDDYVCIVDLVRDIENLVHED